MFENADPTIPAAFNASEWQRITGSFALSKRQAQILGLVIQSRKDEEIVELLNISRSTVRTHLIYTKTRLLAKDRVGLAYRVLVAFREIIEPNSRLT